MLSVRGLSAGYGAGIVLGGIDIDVPPGRITALLGRNGAGRTTLCRAIMGLIPPHGSIRLEGREIAGWPPFQIARAGLGYVPESRDVFPGLTVRQNLLLGLKPGQRDTDGPWSVERLCTLFPNLGERADVAADRLSGGEQQMLAIARTLAGAPRLILIDEPTEGLSPQMTGTVRDMLVRIAAEGAGILLVEQKLTIALEIAEEVYVMGQGAIRFRGPPGALAGAEAIRRDWLEV